MSNNFILEENRFSALQVGTHWLVYIKVNLYKLAKVPAIHWQFIIRVLLVTYLSFGLARLFWLLLPIPNIPSAVINTYDYKNPVSIDNSNVQISELKSLNLFGKANPVKPTATPIDETLAAETHLNITLMGLIASSEEKMARAIFSMEGKQNIYAVGDRLAVGDDVTLSKIMTDGVVINNKGQFESLYLYQSMQKVKPIAAVAPPPMSQAMREWIEVHAEPEIEAPPPKPVIYSADQAITEVGRSMSHVIAMNVYWEGGKMVGYKIQPSRDPGKFKELGLKNDDLIIAINGWPMSNPAQIMEMYQEMNPVGPASLQIKRGGNVVTIDIPPQ